MNQEQQEQLREGVESVLLWCWPRQFLRLTRQLTKVRYKASMACGPNWTFQNLRHQLFGVCPMAIQVTGTGDRGRQAPGDPDMLSVTMQPIGCIMQCASHWAQHGEM